MLKPIEDMLVLFAGNKCNVDILVADAPMGTAPTVGVRIRPWDKDNKNLMILGAGDTLQKALDAALVKARQGRWEALDWAARPWDTVKENRAVSWA